MKFSPALRLIGGLALPVSLGLMLLAFSRSNRQFWDVESLALASFIIAVAYFIAIMVSHLRLNGRRKWHDPAPETYTIALVLFSLSAHTLNASGIEVFFTYVLWMKVLVVGMHLAVLALPYRKWLPEFLQYVLYAISGAGMLVAFHLTIFTLPVSWIGIVAAFFFGLSLHLLVPIWFLAYYIRTLVRSTRAKTLPHIQAAWWTGFLIPVIVLAAYLAQWGEIQRTATETHAQYQAQMEPLFPEWVLFAQQLPEGDLAKYIFLADQFSQKSYWEENWESLGRNWGWVGFRYHDPLSFWARALYGDLEVDWATKIRALEARYDARHMTQRRLWSGSNLATAAIETRLDLYPAYRLAYMEKELWIHNDHHYESNQQEAVYSFYLPDGAVATSLSLWIEGEERLSRLTTRAKADSAYETIVGYERRDPALLHWQEGNRLSVTVFPCTPAEDRRFKIGLTLPMHYASGELSLSNVAFNGPSSTGIRERVEIHWQGEQPQGIDLPFSFEETEPGHFVYEGGYRPNWKLSCTAPPLAGEAFTFNGKNYHAQERSPQSEAFVPTTVILDLNRNWTWYELQQVWEQVKDLEVYVYRPEAQRLTRDNLQSVYNEMAEAYFQLLPLFEIADPGHTLVISKGVANSPFLSDLDETPYAEKSRNWLVTQTEPLHWWELEGEQSPLVETLHRLRVIQYATGDLEQLRSQLSQSSWPDFPETAQQVWVPTAQMLLVEDTTTAVSTTAPDHLYRLFAFQDLMRSMGRQFFDREALEETWIRKAEAAYIVSPVSSLIVLETQHDYERFGIDENENTLGNAAIEGSGAVPEPHEWVLILLLLGVVLFLYRQKLSQLIWTR